MASTSACLLGAEYPVFERVGQRDLILILCEIQIGIHVLHVTPDGIDTIAVLFAKPGLEGSAPLYGNVLKGKGIFLECPELSIGIRVILFGLLGDLLIRYRFRILCSMYCTKSRLRLYW